MIKINEDEYKQPVGSVDDYNKNYHISSLDIAVVLDQNFPHTGEALKDRIIINPSKLEKTPPEFIIAHELGHILSDNCKELQTDIIMNYGNAFGKFNVTRMHFDGVFGEYNPEEAWASSFAGFLDNPEELKSRYPAAYKAVSFITSSIGREDIERLFKDLIDQYNDKTDDIEE